MNKSNANVLAQKSYLRIRSNVSFNVWEIILASKILPLIFWKQPYAHYIDHLLSSEDHYSL